MPLDAVRTRQRLKDFDFQKLFIEELGWDHHTQALPIDLDGRTFNLAAIAQKRGMVAFLHQPASDGDMPDYSTRRKIEHKVAKAPREHLIIYVDPAKTTQVWQWVKREPGKPAVCREHRYYSQQSGELLLQKLGAFTFTLEDEPNLTLPDVTGKVRKGFDVDHVTKRFYDQFKTEHTAFLKFLKGIPDEEMQRWYASVMINRLMFIYFIQKKGFLDGDTDYLRNKLAQSKASGKDRYYRDFLCPLFFEGFAKKERAVEFNKLFGKVPYLNGGIFQRHQIEELHGKTIGIADAAFEKIFDFFDQWDWHLDERPRQAGKEIDPNVLGYIFEKYINQKQMGAYYTKEDITGYISRNTVIPRLFDMAKPKCKIAFDGEHSVWQLLQAEPDRYIYEAVKKGVDLPLPPEIAAGLNEVSKRTQWNKAAPPEHALPTEIWREVVARRKRYEEVWNKLVEGKIREINDLITYNLDIRQFAQDVIENCEGPELLRAFWHAIREITILDPTCGSGAFLFAALNILEPLYEACLDRMEAFLQELDQSSEKHRPEKFSDFRRILAEVAKHPNERYFILKSIILNNLYGVDIMEEATEICKLRLFLKLVAQVERVEDIEPLPDIDFNIRAGNTLVGFTNREQIQRVMTVTQDGRMKMLFAEDMDQMQRIVDKAEDVDRLFDLFRELQTRYGMDSREFAETKGNLRKRLEALENELNVYLATEYGVIQPGEGSKELSLEYQNWLESHKPFHWFIDFYGIMKNGGFDVIIGNPPYVSAAKVRREYTATNLFTLSCPDIYAWVLERTECLLHAGGRSGMIVPLSLSFSGDFAPIRQKLYSAYGQNWFSSFGRIPSALFSFDVRVRNTIHIGYKSGAKGANYTSRLHRWFETARPHLFALLEYATFQPELWKGRIPKLNTQALAAAFEHCLKNAKLDVEASTSTTPTDHVLHFKKTAYNWLNFCRKLPPCYEDDRPVEHTKFGQIYFPNAEVCQLAMQLTDGKLEFVFWCAVGDDFDVTRWNFGEFPIDLSRLPPTTRSKLVALLPNLEAAMEQATQFKLNAGRRVGNYNLAKCRHVTDISDQLFAETLGFSKVWDDIELYCAQVVKTDFSSDGAEDSE